MVLLKLVPMYWEEASDDIMYRIHSRDGICSPEWFTPSMSPRLFAHDTVHHLQYEDCGYGLDACADAHANELIAAGVLYSSGFKGREWHVNSGLASFLSNMPGYEQDKNYWKDIPTWRKCTERDKFIERYFSSDNEHRTDTKDETHSSIIRALSILKRGMDWGDSLSNIDYMRYEIETSLVNTFLRVKEHDYPLIFLEYDFETVRVNLTLQQRNHPEDIPVFYSDYDGC